MAIKRRAVLTAALFSALALGAATAACTDDEPDTAGGASSVSQASLDDLTARLQQDEMLYALVGIEDLKLHEIDDSVQAGTPLERAIPDVRKAVRLMALTDWTTDLEADAQDVHDKLVSWLQALEDGDLEAAKSPSTEAHEGFHEFAESAWSVVVKDLPPDEGGPEPDDEESATPLAEETPAEEATP